MSLTETLSDWGAAALRRLEPETAHQLAIKGLARLPLPAAAPDDPILRTRLAGLDLPNPVGLAAGLDKNAEALRGLSQLGFGFVECGSVTPRPQAGNPRPRLFRLAEDEAVINRMGFNNEGIDAVAGRLAAGPRPGPFGVNVGANKDSADRAADYVAGVRAFAPHADWLTVNISSPNTPGLRDLQSRAALDDLLGRVREALAGSGSPPLFLKVAPDLTGSDVADIAEAAAAHRVAALIVSNTTVERPSTLRSVHAAEVGGLSGAPLFERSTALLADFRSALPPSVALIGAGGVSTVDHVLAKLRAGAAAVQLYSALVYEGPGLAARLKRDLAARLRAEGARSVSEVVGR